MLDSWFRLAAAGADMARAAFRTGEAMIAADSVIRSRSDIIASAIGNPATADYRELSLMLSEKQTAAVRASSDILSQSLMIWADSGKYWRAMAGATRGESASAATLMRQSTNLAIRSMDLYALGLDPFHAAVTKNARRLDRKSSKKGRNA